MMNSAFRQAIDQIDRILARFSLAFFGDSGSLIIPMFHGIYPDVSFAHSSDYDPQQGITLEQFRALVAAFAARGFTFIRPSDIDDGLEDGGKYVMLTFDDGYFNNVSVLPILEEFKVPAVFFISAGHVLEGKAFWWDVLYREMILSKGSDGMLGSAYAKCKSVPTDEAEAWIRAQFKLAALRPTSDLDRPMTPAELKSFSQSKYVVLGNHTLDHAILTNYSAKGVREQIEGGQEALHAMAGVRPSCIAYPNGNHSKSIVEAAREIGLTTGVVAYPGRNVIPIPASGNTRMTLTRVVPWGNKNIRSQCDVFRSRHSLYRMIARRRGLQHASAYENS